MGLLSYLKLRKQAIRQEKQKRFNELISKTERYYNQCYSCRYLGRGNWGSYLCDLRTTFSKEHQISSVSNTCEFYDVPKKVKKYIKFEEDK